MGSGFPYCQKGQIEVLHVGQELWLIDSQQQLVRIAGNGSREALGVSVGGNVEAIAASLEERVVGVMSVGLVLDSTLCFWEPLSDRNKSGKQGGEIRFELEEKIPFDAEEVHFVVDPDCFPGFAVATELAPLKVLVEALQRCDVETVFVVPMALAEWQLARAAWGERDSLYVSQEGNRFDLLVQRGTKLVGWSLAWGVQSLVTRCRVAGGSSGALWAKVDEQAGIELQRAYGEQVTLLVVDCAVSMGGARKRVNWIGNLAIGPLESRKLREGQHRAWQLVLLLALMAVSGFAGTNYYQAILERDAATELRAAEIRQLQRSHIDLPRRRTIEWLVAEIAAKRTRLAAVRDWGERPGLLAEEFPLGLEALAAVVREGGPARRLDLQTGRVWVTGDFVDVGPAERVLEAAGWDIVPQPLGAEQKTKTVDARRRNAQSVVRPSNVEEDR